MKFLCLGFFFFFSTIPTVEKKKKQTKAILSLQVLHLIHNAKHKSLLSLMRAASQFCHIGPWSWTSSSSYFSF